MIRRLLIANRGEIACRIIRTCRRLGVETIAVYSSADKQARHCRLADQAIEIGASAPSASYLNIERIIQAALDSQADAIHPGYGFLSENAAFVRAVSEAGLIFIGPRAETIEAMGSKAAAKQIMATADVPLIPGYHGDDQSEDALRRAAGTVGYPIMLKAAAGGGGKGMRVVPSADEFSEHLAAARREAKGAFGDDRMIIERYIETPRHIEAQIFGDHHGQVIHLYERDCSSQRRHQKIIEEAPATGLSDRTRAMLLEAAVRAGKAVDYVGAGTVEFLVDTATEAFFFLEMNTRLQVEHPVTEAITGLDLVEWQLRIASGEPLPLGQSDIKAVGHAIEARLYAEDPQRGFLPSSGTISLLKFPASTQMPSSDQHPSFRLDAGVDAGDSVGIDYDPMIAKLIVHAQTRHDCQKHMLNVLRQSAVGGLSTNLAFLQDLIRSQAFSQATIDTGLLDRSLDTILNHEPPPWAVWRAAATAFVDSQEAADFNAKDPWSLMDGWRLGTPEPRTISLSWMNQNLDIQVIGNPLTGHDFLHQLNEGQDPPSSQMTIHCLDTHQIDVIDAETRWQISLNNPLFEKTKSENRDGDLVAPMPGLILAVQCSEGDEVAQGEALIVMEAMKMELTLRAPFDGLAERIQVSAGQRVDGDSLLLTVAAKPSS